MSKALLWWLLGFWVSGSVVTHVVYIKRIGWPETARLAPVQVMKGPRWQLLLPGALFARNDLVLAPSAVPSLARAAAYLRAHPGDELTITGAYAGSEAVATIVPDLGRARAGAVAAYLQKLGALPRQLHLRSRRDDALRFADDSTNALIFSLDPGALPLAAAPVTVQQLANAQRYSTLWRPMELYFPLGSIHYLHTPHTERFVTAAAAYLRAHPKALLLTTAHTDSLGLMAWNLDMALARATEVKARLLTLGVRAAQIQMVQRGAASPIAPNRTPAGRLANRRVSLALRP
ncbi:OmpA family protein [Hymenobacter crusticola]|uniref:OmpA-like domain-containing protein n=1 Tax=Hymenobacter crusticola TaxID=1770526 RepID=A0A243WIH6_9BACT|nr:OmpA family protein [Hymenobacter crusticola]OUJ74809.1 hypothetical protein BXP70_08620 [Hymenobacter crusticola]